MEIQDTAKKIQKIIEKLEIPDKQQALRMAIQINQLSRLLIELRKEYESANIYEGIDDRSSSRWE